MLTFIKWVHFNLSLAGGYQPGQTAVIGNPHLLQLKRLRQFGIHLHKMALIILYLKWKRRIIELTHHKFDKILSVHLINKRIFLFHL